MFRGKTLLVSLLVAGLTFAAVAPAQIAEAAACRNYDTVAKIYHSTEPHGQVWYRTANTSTVPSSSGCADINLTRASIVSIYGENGCANFRVRFFPSSGGSYTNSPKLACNGIGSLVLASSVKNGTVYRVEVDKPVYFHIFD